MRMLRMVKRSILVICAGFLLTALSGATPAFAVEPWWQMSSDTAPATLRPGLAKSEVQEITVSATSGRFVLSTEPEKPSYVASHEFEWDANHQEVQAGLEEMFGAGNVEVPSGQGDAGGSEPYKVIFKGELAERAVEAIGVEHYGLKGGNKETGDREATKGRSDATLILRAANVGDADLTGPVKISAKLPPGLRAVHISGTGGFVGGTQLECSLESLSCTYPEVTLPDSQVQLIVAVDVKQGATSGEANEVLVSGGNALPAKMTRAITVGNTAPAFGVEDFEMAPEEEGGAIATQAGSHPFQLTTKLVLNQEYLDHPYQSRYAPNPTGLAKNLTFKLPPGLIGNPTPFPRCRLPQFDLSQNFVNGCPDDTAIGVAAVTITVPGIGYSFLTVPVPLFNLTPSVGEPARFGFEALGVPVYLDTSVRTGEDYGVTVKVTNVTQAAIFLGSRVTFWGVPGDPRHDNERGWSCLAGGIWQRSREGVPPCAATAPHFPPPFLELPTSCTGPLQTSVEASSWEQPEDSQLFGPTVALPALDGCNQLPFNPSITVTPDGQAGSTATGLTVGVHVPQDVSLGAEGLGEGDVKSTTVTLPAGVALNPAAADGLLACSEEEIALSTHTTPTCPEASKVATVEIVTPLLPNPLVGEAYLAAQDANPFGSLVALYLVAQDPVSGTLIKVAGEVKADPVTGQLVSTFNNTPQLPFEDLKLHFFGGSRAPLSTPAACGTYTTTTSIASWSGNPPSEPSSSFQVLSGPNGSACASPLPFSPSLTAGTTSIQAGGFSPFTMTMSRPDGSQNLQAIKLKMPPGLLGTLASVKLCKEAQADAGLCGPESLIGHTTVSVGVGGNPYTVTGGEVFITEGYEGAPYGLSIVNPAKAGPFDLGKVIVRAKIEVDPLTAALTITTDNSGLYKIPTILDGIPLQIQHVEVSVDRANFTFNPTNCSSLQVGGSLYSSEGSSAAVKVPFQITNCAVLAFKPKLTAKTAGKTSRKAGASLSVKLTYPAGPYDANIAKVKVDLPKQLPSRLTTLQKACPAATFEANPAACPSASIVGHATATTPVLPVPLTGPAYFVSHAGEEFPSLIIVLQGYGATVHLVGTTFINNKTNVTSSTFKAIPDVPVGTFELTLPQGLYSALAATANLCTTKLAMPTSFVGQNGAEIHTSTPITPTGCAKHKAAKKTKKKAGPKKGKKGKKK
ncbi:MAG TPA: hypothetical protein VIJ39_11325 [Solirubrobacteraceae bacterium]